MKTATTPDDAAFAYTLKALSNPVRLEIVRYIARHPGCICNQLVLALGKAQPTISQHLRVLRVAGLIEGEEDGAATCYCVKRERLHWLQCRMADLR